MGNDFSSVHKIHLGLEKLVMRQDPEGRPTRTLLLTNPGAVSVDLCYLHSSGTPGRNMTSQKREKFSSMWKKHVPKHPKETLKRQYKQHWNWIVLNSMPKQRPLYQCSCCQPLSCTNAFFGGKARSSAGERRSLQRIKSHSLEAWHVELWTLTASSLLFLWLSAVTHCSALPLLRWGRQAVLCSATPQPQTCSSTSMWT